MDIPLPTKSHPTPDPPEPRPLDPVSARPSLEDALAERERAAMTEFRAGRAGERSGDPPDRE